MAEFTVDTPIVSTRHNAVLYLKANSGPDYGVVWWELELDGVVAKSCRPDATSGMATCRAPDGLYASALLDALNAVPKDTDIVLINDYEAFHGAFSKDFLTKWESENFKGRPIWREISHRLKDNHITVRWCKAERGSGNLRRLKALQTPQIGFNGFNRKAVS